jgi:hypothetical protein
MLARLLGPRDRDGRRRQRRRPAGFLRAAVADPQVRRATTRPALCGRRDRRRSAATGSAANAATRLLVEIGVYAGNFSGGGRAASSRA